MASRRGNLAADAAEASMFNRLAMMIEENTTRVHKLEQREVSEASRAILRYAVADLPTPTVNKHGWLAIATDGRKSGEGVGVGTGCPVWCGDNGSGSYKWLTFYDNSEIQS